MKTIPLTQGKVAIVDDADYEAVNQFKWTAFKKKNTFYAYRKCNGKTLMLHQFLLPGARLVDHRNHNGLDNRRENLRPATHSQNLWNGQKKSGESKHKGVYWNKEKQLWQSQITVKYQKHYLGRFSNEDDAGRAYDKAAVLFFGEFAKTNFKDERQ